ncbi:MAG TPA: site-2 protease family protein [Acidimicrobiales bacterium]|nr:site-2 protease family protein [Acidimicrobiales bacterium]
MDDPKPPLGAPQRTLILLGAGALVLYLLARREVVGREDALLLAVLVPSVILHEISHGALALVFGDDTAKEAGRLTLNPVRHVDPFGTLILPAVLILAGAQPFGYAKPVPVSVNKLRSPRNHNVLVALVGPAVNIGLALLAAFAVRSAVVVVGGSDVFVRNDSLLLELGLYFGLVNVVLAAFNLIPVPPLDGSAVVERLLPARWWPPYLRFRQYSMFLLFGLVFLLPDLLGAVFDPATELWLRLL